MRWQTKTFVEKFLKDHAQGKTLEVGSLDVNGQLRSYFKDYTGSDMREGPNVDVVVNGHNLLDKFEKESFDIVLCFDTFEHDTKFWETWNQMRKVLKVGGYALMGAPGRNCPTHEHPGDYWRFMNSSLPEYFFQEGWDDTNFEYEVDDEVYGWGRKI